MNQEIKPPIQSEDAEDLFPYLPSEIMLNILSRIPARTIIMSCKYVCKAWLDLLETSEFVQSHLSKSVPGLAVYLRSKSLKQVRIVEFADEHRLNIVFSFDLPFIGSAYIVHTSAKGLLFVCNPYWIENPRDFVVCNPITREYITIPPPLEASSRHAIYGFGVSKMSGEYKVVRISLDAVDCHVYTVGYGSWRRIASDDQLRYYKRDAVGAFLNGNLHWLAYKEDSSFHDLICCLDLETERFRTFSPPPPHEWGDYNYKILSALGDYLCVCDTSVEREVVGYIDIWLMKEYEDDKSWTKEFHFDSGYGVLYHCPIKVFNDGDILMQWGSTRLLYYSKKHGHRESVREVDLFKDDCSCATIYAPSFLPLKTFAMENVTTF